MQTIKTATGKEFEISWAGVATIDEVFRFELKNSDMGTSFTVFSNPVETETLTHYFDNIPKEYIGYTTLRGVAMDMQGGIVVSLAKT